VICLLLFDSLGSSAAAFVVKQIAAAIRPRIALSTDTEIWILWVLWLVFVTASNAEETPCYNREDTISNKLGATDEVLLGYIQREREEEGDMLGGDTRKHHKEMKEMKKKKKEKSKKEKETKGANI
jgi:hypothetical protein